MSHLNNKRLYDIIRQTTISFDKDLSLGEMSADEYLQAVPEVVRDNSEKYDMILYDILVDTVKAGGYRNEFSDILEEYPNKERLTQGISYLELTPNLGLTEEDTLRFMALGSSFGLWNIVSGRSQGLDEEESKELAKKGFIMIDGYKR